MIWGVIVLGMVLVGVGVGVWYESVSRRAYTRLLDPDWQVREQTVITLGKLFRWKHDSDDLEILIQSMYDPAWQVRNNAAESIVRMLPTLLRPPNRRASSNIAMVMTEVLTPLITAFVAILNDETAIVREKAIVALPKLRHYPGTQKIFQAIPVEVLTDALQSSDAAVRREAATLSGLSHNVQVITPLLHAVHDADDDVRDQAEIALIEPCGHIQALAFGHFSQTPDTQTLINLDCSELLDIRMSRLQKISIDVDSALAEQVEAL